MIRLPSDLAGYLVDHSLTGRSPVCLVVGRNERLDDVIGDCSAYGLGPLEPGTSVLDQVWFLEGLLPLRQPSLSLPCVQIGAGLWADVHIVRHGRKHWVLFLAVTDDELLHLRLFEKANENALLRDRHARILDQYLGKELVKALEEGKIAIGESGVRRQVSILFADIRGFTSFSEVHEPEVVFAMLNRYLEAMIRPLLEESAVVDKIMGDAVMGVFGILTRPVSPPHQAVVAGMKILSAVAELNRELFAAGKTVLEVGIGISTGPVAGGILGSAVRKSFSVVGHHVNLAARLQGRAGPLEILVDENTFREIVTYQPSFQETTIRLKGIADEVKVFSYRVHAGD
ncbi:MAG TPA: adenylate/guanylate cyclase domain-containing protein [Deltaproteobacteria bacterium]|nr:adenylate/guanylate cyclase domain-containing protein [Deltaproteobacteria bacterium]